MAVSVGSGKVKSEPNVVPLCDVLLVLLIIFMVITPIVQKGMDVKLPETTADAAGVPAGLIVLTLKSDLSVMINQEEVPRHLLAQRLESIYSTRQDKTALVRADARVTYDKVIELLDIARGAGVEVIGIIPEFFQEDESSTQGSF